MALNDELAADRVSTNPDLANDRIKIHNWPDANPPINDETVLVRYMKLETFLLLLDGRVFIPTLKQLQTGDRIEGLLPFSRSRSYLTKMDLHVRQFKNWLLNAAGNPKAIFSDEATQEQRELHDLAVAEQSMRHQLARRRCVWCWNQARSDLSYLMWKIYGDRGVAVFSTIGKIRQTLADCGAEGIVSAVRYLSPTETIPLPEFNLLEEHFQRPHLFKDAGYQAEQEVRFVLKVDPARTKDSRGVIASLNTKSLVDTAKAWPFVKASPFLPWEEQLSIESLARKRLFPAIGFDPLAGTLQSPFAAESDLPSGLFSDLDFP